jgi:hypothetical protein
MKLCEGWVTTPSSANSLVSRGFAFVVHDEPGVDADRRPRGRQHQVGVGVTAETAGGLEAGHVVGT